MNDTDLVAFVANHRCDLWTALKQGKPETAMGIASRLVKRVFEWRKRTGKAPAPPVEEAVRLVAYLQFGIGKIEIAREILERAGVALPGSVSFCQDGNIGIGQTDIASFRDAEVFPYFWLVHDPRLGVAHTDLTASFSFLLHGLDIWRNGERTVMLHRKGGKQRIDQSLFLLGSKNNYKHWVTDYLPRAKSFLENGSDAKLLVGEGLKGYHRDSLSRIGIGQDLLVTIREIDTVSCAELHVGAMPRRGDVVAPWAMDWLFERFQSSRPEGPEKLYVSRNDANVRRVLNEASVISELETLGFMTVTPGALSFQEQVEVFSNARIVVGLHGAGLANIAFARRNATLIEIVPCDPESQERPQGAEGFRQMTLASGRAHFFLKANSASTGPTGKDSDSIVDIKMLRHQIASVE
jgi:capsular polysaccharide biosynthesis protein